MIKRTRKYISQKSIPEIIRTIEKYSEDEPLFSGNHLTYFQEFDKSLKGSNSFYKTPIADNLFKLRSKSLKYWPISIIDLKRINDQETLVTIKYKLFGLYLTMFVGFFTAVLGLIILAVSDKNEEPLGTLLAALIFLTVTLLLLYFFSWLQRNLIKLIKTIANN